MGETSLVKLLADEKIRSEATFEFRVEDFSKLKKLVVSSPTYLQNLRWEIMVAACRTYDIMNSEWLSVSLQCTTESEATSWRCNAKGELRLKSFKPDRPPFSRKFNHIFNNKDTKRNYTHFMLFKKILDPRKGYVRNDTIVVEAHVVADLPLFDNFENTRTYVGLINKDAICYMNSSLQILYFTNQFREAVYKMPIETDDDGTNSVTLALQKVFYKLQCTDKAVSAYKLLKNLDWTSDGRYCHQDAHEFLRAFLSKLESLMQGTCVEGTIPRLFEGVSKSYIKCKNVDYTNENYEHFYDIQLHVKGMKNINESFKYYIEKEILDGDRKFKTDEHGDQVAEKGTIFRSFPPVLNLHLIRFEFDAVTNQSAKLNDYFEFYEEIVLDDYLENQPKTPAKYKLHAVLAHSGYMDKGHYVAYINPLGDGEWWKFNDAVVSKCSKKEAIEENYGATGDAVEPNKHNSMNAYMLMYIEESAIDTVLKKIELRDIPQELIDRFAQT